MSVDLADLVITSAGRGIRIFVNAEAAPRPNEELTATIGAVASNWVAAMPAGSEAAITILPVHDEVACLFTGPQVDVDLPSGWSTSTVEAQMLIETSWTGTDPR